MKVTRSLFGSICIFLVCIWGAAAQDPGVISGVIRDAQGKELAGANVTLVRADGSSTVYRAVSGPAGEYRFTGLAAGRYRLRAELKGYVADEHEQSLVSPGALSRTADLALKPEHENSWQDSGNTGRPPVQFQASGIRGLIDPGGYSASANAEAAAGILRGMADAKRMDESLEISSVTEWPCELQPSLEAAVKEQPSAESYRKLGVFYLVRQRPDQAIPFLQQALRIDAADFNAERDLGIAELQLGRFEEARQDILLLLQKRDVPQLHQLLARSLEGVGDFQRAALEYQKAESEESSELSVFGAGYELILAGRVTEALRVFQEGRLNFSGSIPIQIGEGTAQFLGGRADESVRTFLRTIDLNPMDSRPYVFLAAASGVSRQEKERVRDSFKRYLERVPDSAAANYYYALVLSRESPVDNPGQIETLLKRAIQLDPNLAKAHLLLADLYARQQAYQKAVPEYQAAIRLAPKLSDAHYGLAMAYRRLGKTDQSMREQQEFERLKLTQSIGSRDQEIDLSQFVSVMGGPERRNISDRDCPTVSRTPVE